MIYVTHHLPHPCIAAQFTLLTPSPHIQSGSILALKGCSKLTNVELRYTKITGMPGVTDPNAFAVLCLSMVVLGVLLYNILRLLKWF